MENEFMAFRRMVGAKCMRDINNSIAQAIFEESGIEKHVYGLYKLTVKIDYVDPICCQEHPIEKKYFKKQYPNTMGIPFNILKECIELPEGLTIQSVSTWDLSQIYHSAPRWWRCLCGGAIAPISANFEVWFTADDNS